MSKVSSAIKKFIAIPLTYKVFVGFALGISVGVAFRNFTSEFLFLHVNVVEFKLLGTIFINLIRMIVAPMMFTSIISAILSVGDVGKTGSLAVKSIVTFLIMTAISVVVGIVAANAIQPGSHVKFDKHDFIANAPVDIINSPHSKATTVSSFIMSAVPSNIFESFYTNNFLQIIFFATLFAISIISVGERAKSVINSVNVLAEVMMDITGAIMHFAPFGIFGLTSWLIGTQDLELIKSLGMLVATLYAGCFFVIFILYPLFAGIFLRINPLHFMRKMLPAQFFGYVLASSSAALPMSLKIAHDKLGVSKEKTNFVIPLGATINMNGGAIHLATCTLFIAQLWNVEFGVSQYVTLVTLCVFGAIGTAPIPGVATFLLTGILASMGLPMEAVGIILAVDRLLDMVRTLTNVTGDVFSAVIIDKLDKTMDVKKYAS